MQNSPLDKNRLTSSLMAVSMSKNATEGHVFNLSLITYFVAYFAPTNREPDVYERFGDLAEALQKPIGERYPKVIPPFKAHLKVLLTSTDNGLASTEFRSEAKTKLIERLTAIRGAPLEKAA